jgi:hypothetical protein
VDPPLLKLKQNFEDYDDMQKQLQQNFQRPTLLESMIEISGVDLQHDRLFSIDD